MSRYQAEAVRRISTEGLMRPDQGSLLGSLPVRYENSEDGGRRRGSVGSAGSDRPAPKPQQQRRISQYNPRNEQDPSVYRRGEQSDEDDDDDDGDDGYYEAEADPVAVVEQLRAYAQVPDRSESKIAIEFLSQKSDTIFAVDQIFNMPLFTGSTRVTIYFALPNGKVVTQIPSLIPLASVQSDGSLCHHPMFPNLVTRAPVTPKVVGVITVEIIDRRTKLHHTFGHLIVPLWGKRGHFEQRLRPGPVNADLLGLHSRNVGGGVDDTNNSDDGEGFGRDGGGLTATATSSSRSFSGYNHFLPLVGIQYRVNQTSAMGAPFILFEPTMEERSMAMERPPDNSKPGDHGLRAAVAENIFNNSNLLAPGGPRGEPPDLGAYLYNHQVGVVLTVHSLAGFQPQSNAEKKQDAWAVLYKVIVSTGGENESRVSFTREHNWDADVRRPEFNDFTFVVRDFRYDPLAHFLIQVVEMRPTFDGPEGIQWQLRNVAFAFVPIFVSEEQFVRFSASIPVQMFHGEPPEVLLSTLKTLPVNEVLLDAAKSGMVVPIASTAKVSMADALRAKEIREERFKSLARSALAARSASGGGGGGGAGAHLSGAPVPLRTALCKGRDVAKIASSANLAIEGFLAELHEAQRQAQQQQMRRQPLPKAGGRR